MTGPAPFFLLVTILLLLVVLLIFGMKYFTSARTAQLRIASENSYRTLAERAVLAEEANAATLSQLKDLTLRIDGRLAEVETILKAVG